MTDTTPRFGFPFPEDDNDPDGPAQLEALALAIEERLGFAGGQGGAKIIPGEQARTNTSYGLLGTPDRVQGIVVPDTADAHTLLMIAYRAMWKTSASQQANAAIFIDSDQLKVLKSTGNTPVVQETNTSVQHYGHLGTGPTGLFDQDFGTDGLSEVTTGQILGVGAANDATSGFAAVFVDPGTYDISVQFKIAGGATVSVKNRRLYVYTREFPVSGV